MPSTRPKTNTNKKKTNPLYVVTNEGSVVEEAHGFIDAWIKRLNLGPVIGLLETIMRELLSLVTNFQMLSLVKEWFDQWVNFLTKLASDKGLKFTL
jgi:hypothetical protein